MPLSQEEPAHPTPEDTEVIVKQEQRPGRRNLGPCAAGALPLRTPRHRKEGKWWAQVPPSNCVSLGNLEPPFLRL